MDTHEDEGLWDELSNAQSREIQQHHYRVAAATRTKPQTVAVIRNVVQQAAQQTATAISSAASAAANTAASLTSSYRSVPTTSPLQNNNENQQNLADFGLHNSEFQNHYEEFKQHGGDDGGRQDPLLRNYDYGYHHRHHLEQEDHWQEDENGTSLSSRNNNNTYYNDTNFVFLRNFRLLPKRDGWGAVANLDLFFSSLYNYYYHRGLVPIIGKGIVELVTLFFTLWLSVFLFAHVDWKELAKCTDETSCHASFDDYIIHKPFSTISLWNFIVILYCILFLCYGVFAVWGFLHTVRDAFEAKHVFEEKLGISARKLEGGAVEWDRDVVSKILELQQSGEYRIAIHGQDLDALVVAQRILRKESFMVAFFNRNMLDLSVPFLPGTYFCSSLEWSLYFCILNYMFNHKYEIRPAFYLDPSSLKRRFMLCGVAHAVFMPFLLFFMTLHFSMVNVYDWKSKQKYMGPREWSLSAKWTMREFNELPHFFERRLGPSYEAAESYLKLFTQNTIVTSIARLLVFVGGSLGVVLLLFGALNDAILLHVNIGNWNLVWYVAVMGTIFSAGKAMLPDPEVHPPYARNLFAEMDAKLAQVAAHTHYYPDIWKGRGWDRQTYKQFSAMFRYKAQLFLMEVVSVVLAPLVLCLSLPKCAEHICEFVMAVKKEVPGAGDVCGYTTFDFDAFQDENWEGRTIGTGVGDATCDPLDRTGSLAASLLTTQNDEVTETLHPRPKARQGKMEKSFFSFKADHPSWKCSESGQHLVDQVEKYQYNETIALSRERQHHMEAAARQLETLAQLEKRKQEKAFTAASGLGKVDEAYIGQMTPETEVSGGADSGGGGTVHASLPETIAESSPALPPPSTLPSSAASATRVHFDHLQMPARSGGTTPPPFASAESPMSSSHAQMSSTLTPSRHYGALSPSPSHNPAAASVLHYADTGLSTELRRMLNRSTLDPDVSVAGSVLTGGAYGPASASMHGPLASLLTEETADRDQTAERQYLWLERYHSYLAEQRGQQNSANPSAERGPDLNASDAGVGSRTNRTPPTGGDEGGASDSNTMSSIV